MRKRLYILLVALAFGLTTNALAQSFSTGSDMMNTGSSLSSNVYGVGAVGVDAMYGTTANGPMRRNVLNSDDDPWGSGAEGGEADNGSPIGTPYIMLLFAAGAAGVVALRRRRTANS